jgi:hypothetical protein
MITLLTVQKDRCEKKLLGYLSNMTENLYCFRCTLLLDIAIGL